MIKIKNARAKKEEKKTSNEEVINKDVCANVIK